MVPHRRTSGQVPSRSMRPRCTLITTVSMTEPIKLAISLYERLEVSVRPSWPAAKASSMSNAPNTSEFSAPVEVFSP